MHQEGTGAGINVGPGVGDLTSSLEDLRDNLVASLHEVNKVVVLNVFISKLELAHEARVSLTEDSVTVSGNDLAGGKSILNILSNIIFIPVLSKLGL